MASCVISLPLDPDTTWSALALAGAEVPLSVLSQWTEAELLVAYDWAIREHLAASDNPVRRRPRPRFVGLAVAGIGTAEGHTT